MVDWPNKDCNMPPSVQEMIGDNQMLGAHYLKNKAFAKEGAVMKTLGIAFSVRNENFISLHVW